MMPWLREPKGRSAVWRSLWVFLVVTLAGCAGTDKPKPQDLGPNVAVMGVRTAWTAQIGPVRYPLQTRVVDKLAYVADSEGTVAAIDVRTGGDLWRIALGIKISAGVGSDGRYVAVVSRDHELVVLEAGQVRWRQSLAATTLTAPLVAGARVFVLSADRSISAFDAANGRRLWHVPRSGDALVLGRSGVIMAVGDTLVVGVGGKLVGINPQNGRTRWESQIANSRGTNEVERLVDLVAGVSRQQQVVCARAFQSAVGCVDTDRGTVIWSKAASGAAGVDGDAEHVFATESNGRILSYRRTDGERVWASDRLRLRNLSAPLLLGPTLVVGDDTGTVHFLSSKDGSPLNRLSTDGSAISGNLAVAGNTLVAVTERGGVFGFKPD